MFAITAATEKDGSGVIIWTPGSAVQAHMEGASTTDLAALEGLLAPSVQAFGMLLSSAILFGPGLERTVEELADAISEIAQRSIIRMGNHPDPQAPTG